MKNYLSILLFICTTLHYTSGQVSIDELKSTYMSDDLDENKPKLMLADFLGENGEESEFADLCYFIMDDLINDLNYFSRSFSICETPIGQKSNELESNAGYNMAVIAYIKNDQVVTQMQLSKDQGMTILTDKKMSVKVESVNVDLNFNTMPNGKKYSKALASFYEGIAAVILNDLLSTVASNERLREDPEGQTMLIDDKNTFLLVFEDINMTQARSVQSSIRDLDEIDQVKIRPQNHHHLTIHAEMEIDDLVPLISQHLGEDHIIISQESNTIYLEQL